MNPSGHKHICWLIPSRQVPSFWHGLPRHSLISENIQRHKRERAFNDHDAGWLNLEGFQPSKSRSLIRPSKQNNMFQTPFFENFLQFLVLIWKLSFMPYFTKCLWKWNLFCSLIIKQHFRRNWWLLDPHWHDRVYCTTITNIIKFLREILREWILKLCIKRWLRMVDAWPLTSAICHASVSGTSGQIYQPQS